MALPVTPPGTTRTIEIADYSPAWPETFAGLSSVVSGALGGLALRIEHVGSTSVPRLAAKPIIDLDIVIGSRRSLPSVVEALAEIGYFHEGNGGIPGREQFGREDGEVPRDGTGRQWPDHHLYVCAQDSEELRGHPYSAFRYEELKRDLAAHHPHDIESYVEGKSEFVEQALSAARTL
jgi:GrpB-like predicted nucleotidyltransferase (UPF0157 family)